MKLYKSFLGTDIDVSKINFDVIVLNKTITIQVLLGIEYSKALHSCACFIAGYPYINYGQLKTTG